MAEKPKEKTKEELAKEQFLAQIQEVSENYDKSVTLLKEKGYDQHGYRPGQTLEVDSEFFILLSQLVPVINTQIQTMVEGIKSVFNNTVTLAEMASIHLLRLNTSLMDAHFKNAEQGRSVHKDDLDKDDAPKKIIEVPSNKIITDLNV